MSHEENVLEMQVVQAGGGNHSLSHAVDIYRGANNASIRRNNHNQLDVHGLGKEFRWAAGFLPYACSLHRGYLLQKHVAIYRHPEWRPHHFMQYGGRLQGCVIDTLTPGRPLDATHYLHTCLLRMTLVLSTQVRQVATVLHHHLQTLLLKGHRLPPFQAAVIPS